MRIGMVSPYSFDVPGGVQFHIRDLAEHLIGAGHDVNVLAPSENDADLPPYVTSAGRAIPVRFNGSTARLSFGIAASSRVNRWLEDGNFDVVHVHEPLAPSLGLLAVWGATTPVVATFHTAYQRSRTLQAVVPLLRPSIAKIMGRIAVSPAAKSTILRHIGGEVEVIPNGVNCAALNSPERNPDWVGTPTAPTLAFMGRMREPRKGLDVLLQAVPLIAQKHPGVRVLIGGTGAPPSHLPPGVELLGPIPEEQKAAFLASPDIYVAPNTGGESFGMILTEAMAAGACILASDLHAFADVLAGVGGRHYRNRDPESLAAEAVKLLDDVNTCEQFRQAGTVRAQDFDWSVVGAHIMAVYETVLATYEATQEVDPRSSWNSRKPPKTW